jgi:ABC-type multidrug transport system fused ATPase/permease subunit
MEAPGTANKAADFVSPLKFNDDLRLEGVIYHYPEGDGPVLDDVTLTIPFRQSVALVGRSGAGKTTLVDVILGLLEPTGGSLKVDGVNLFDDLAGWQRRIGYIPQEIYLTDDTLRNNIALGVDEADIDEARVEDVVKTVHLEDFIVSLAEGLDTILGERGARVRKSPRLRPSRSLSLLAPLLERLDKRLHRYQASFQGRHPRAVE